MKLLTSEILEILEDGQLQRLTYTGLLACHRGNAVWGARVGYRAMQAAGWALSHGQLWDCVGPGNAFRLSQSRKTESRSHRSGCGMNP